MTGIEFLRAVKKIGDVRILFKFPYTYLIYVDDEFESLDPEEREIAFSDKLGTNVDEIRAVQQNTLISLQLLTAEEAKEDFQSSKPRSHRWIESFIESELSGNGHSPASANVHHPKTIHFYGYKGGQARSTLVALVAQSLADDGWKVLAIDSDTEAPSLDVIFNRASRNLGSTFLGLTQHVGPFVPERIPSAQGSGFVDLVCFRPQSPEFDIDAAALALKISLDPTVLEDTAKILNAYAIQHSIDAILVDHRAGLSAATLPWMHCSPGPTVVCVRLDEQWSIAKNSIRSILSTNPMNPGVFVSWKPDEEVTDYYVQRNYQQAVQLLDLLAEVISAGGDQLSYTNPQLELSFAELQDHWIIWPYDQAFRQRRLPSRKDLQKGALDSISRLRSILEVEGQKRPVPAIKQPLPSTRLSPSGATDTGDLIQTEALRQLTTPGNSISYILGRKGTGKTRLLRELGTAGLGEPLVVDPYDRGAFGLRSNSPELGRASVQYRDNPINLWWALLSSALENKSTDTIRLTNSFSNLLKRDLMNDPVADVLSKIDNTKQRIFLLDGLETAFNANSVFQFIESLFRFLQIIETDSRIAYKVQFKLFLRTDLAQRGYQNVEQQLHGRTIYLSWDTQKIFNFVLSRIAQIPWYNNHFSDLVSTIKDQYDQILAGALSIEECEDLLMMAFPDRLSTNNLSTKTFLKTYFADTASDKPELSANNRLRYYPRVFDKFLEVIADPQPTELGSFTGQMLDKNGKISQGLIFFAHEAAAVDYIQQLRSELNYLIRFSDDPNENSEKVNALLPAFDGLKTPFTVDELVQTLALRTNIDESDVRSAMNRMKNLGLFEDRPGYPEQWRVGRLFKSALRMKYVRGTPYGH